MKNKVGDKVRVRKDLVVDKVYGDLTFMDEMERHKGQVVTIKTVDSDGDYTLEEDNCNWCWNDEMFEDYYVADDIKSSEITVKDLLDKTLLELGGFIVSIVNSSFEVSMGNNYIKRDTELYKRFIKAYGDMAIKNVSVEPDDSYRKLIIYVED